MERWIDDGADLAGALAGVGKGPLAVDTEADSMHHYEAKLCLIQLSFGEADVLVDPLALPPGGRGGDLAPLGRLLADPGLRKVMHAADYDLRMLGLHHGLAVRGLFDTLIAARLVGERAFGLAALVRKYLGVTLDKRFQTADWSRRPLPAELRAYAARDTRHLIELSARLEQRLVELGRQEWAAEEFRRLETLERQGTSAAAGKPPHERVKGASGLARRELALLRALAELRESAARSTDRPPFRIARDEVLLDLARDAARGRYRAGTAVTGWHPAIAGAVPATLERALALDPAQWPPALDGGRRAVVDPRVEVRVRRACAARDRVAAALDLDPTLLASRGQIEQALGLLPEGVEARGERGLRRWQAALLGPVLGQLGGPVGPAGGAGGS
jgi:ribonuclease D